METSNSMVKAVILDMDGVMVDTEPVQHKAFCWLVEREGKQPKLHPNGLVHWVGITERENVARLKEKYGLRGKIEEMVKERQKYYQNLLKTELRPMPGLDSLIDLLRDRGIPMAIASSSAIENVEIVLKALRLQEVIKVVVSGTEVKRGKPAPDVYLKAAQDLGVEVKNCWVIEDAANGIEAGKRAGMRVIAVTSQYTRDQNFSKADRIVNSLGDVTGDMIGSAS